jgi:hypothetical protein
MSYEGHVQLLCGKGHLTIKDAYEDCLEPDRQSHHICCCGELFVWCHSVDDTNCDGENAILEISTPEVREKCDHCGHVTIKEEERYKIPKGVGGPYYYPAGRYGPSGEVIENKSPITSLLGVSRGGGG